MLPGYTIHISSIKLLLCRDSAIYDQNHCAGILCFSDFRQIPEHIPFRHSVSLVFQDIYDPADRNAFNSELAEELTRFIFTLPDGITDLYIACDAGAARSPAIAAALLRASHRSDKTIWKNPRYYPNPLVYKTVCQAFHLHTPKIMIRFRVRLNHAAFRNAQRNHK